MKNRYNEAMYGTHLKAGLKWAMEISRLGNQYLQDAEPWTVLKTNPELCGTICYVAVNLIYLISNIFEIIPAGHKINEILPIFKRIEPEEVKAYREKFGGHN